MEIGRNEPCTCGSGKKYKNCCLKKKQEKELLKNKLNILYGKVKSYNNKLLDLSNKNKYEKTEFEDAIHLAITDNGLSLIKSFLEEISVSHTSCLNARNIIENYVLLRMYDAGDINEKHIELFRAQYYIIEYNNYKTLCKNVPKEFISIDNLKEGYNWSKKVFLKYIDKKEFEEIKNSRILFLCDSTISYNKLIKKYCDKYLDLYIKLSKYVHPSLYDADSIDLNAIICQVLKLLIKLYDDRQDSTNDTTYYYEKNCLYGLGIDLPDNYNLQLFNLNQQVLNEYNNICTMFNCIYGPKAYPLSFFRDLSYAFIDVNTDVMLGYSEIAKIKFKVIVEMLSVFNKVYFNTEKGICDYYYKMMELHIEYKSMENEIKKDEISKRAFDLFKNFYSNSIIDYSRFKESFDFLLGYFIKENGEVPSYTRITKDFIREMCQDRKIKNLELTYYKLFVLSYFESQSMSHGQGYLYFVNSGAWNDGRNILGFLDTASIFILNKMFLWFKAFSISEEIDGETHINITIASKLEQAIKNLDRINKKRYKIFLIPPIQKNF